jgi:hypothetical protein
MTIAFLDIFNYYFLNNIDFIAAAAVATITIYLNYQ